MSLARSQGPTSAVRAPDTETPSGGAPDPPVEGSGQLGGPGWAPSITWGPISFTRELRAGVGKAPGGRDTWRRIVSSTVNNQHALFLKKRGKRTSG